MLSTRERNESKIRYERTNEYEPIYRNDYYAENSYTGYETYPDERRVTEEERYIQRYENLDCYDQQYECRANENTFRPIELSDINVSAAKPAVKKHSKIKINMSTKSKIMVGVYFALVTLIVVMLLVNALPSASAQGAASAAPTQAEVIDQKGFDQSYAAAASESGLEQTSGYTYDTETNWFDKMCDSIGNMFN